MRKNLPQKIGTLSLIFAQKKNKKTLFINRLNMSKTVSFKLGPRLVNERLLYVEPKTSLFENIKMPKMPKMPQLPHRISEILPKMPNVIFPKVLPDKVDLRQLSRSAFWNFLAIGVLLGICYFLYNIAMDKQRNRLTEWLNYYYYGTIYGAQAEPEPEPYFIKPHNYFGGSPTTSLFQ
jgi:hypothetical protein